MPAGHAFDQLIVAKEAREREEEARKAAKRAQNTPAPTPTPAPVTLGQGVKLPDSPAPAPAPQGQAAPVWGTVGKPAGLIFDEFLARKNPPRKPTKRPPGKGTPATTAAVPQTKAGKPTPAGAASVQGKAAAVMPAATAKVASGAEASNQAAPASPSTDPATPAKPTPAAAPAKAAAGAKPAAAGKPGGPAKAGTPGKPAGADKAAAGVKPAGTGKSAGGAKSGVGAKAVPPVKGAAPPVKGAASPVKGAAPPVKAPSGKGTKEGAVPATKPAAPAPHDMSLPPAPKGIHKILDIFRKKGAAAAPAKKPPPPVESKKTEEEKARATEAFLGKGKGGGAKGRPVGDIVEPRPTSSIGVVGQHKGDLGVDPDTFVSAAVHVMHRLFETVPEHHKGLDDDHRVLAADMLREHLENIKVGRAVPSLHLGSKPAVDDSVICPPPPEHHDTDVPEGVHRVRRRLPHAVAIQTVEETIRAHRAADFSVLELNAMWRPISSLAHKFPSASWVTVGANARTAAADELSTLRPKPCQVAQARNLLAFDADISVHMIDLLYTSPQIFEYLIAFDIAGHEAFLNTFSDTGSLTPKDARVLGQLLSLAKVSFLYLPHMQDAQVVAVLHEAASAVDAQLELDFTDDGVAIIRMGTLSRYVAHHFRDKREPKDKCARRPYYRLDVPKLGENFAKAPPVLSDCVCAARPEKTTQGTTVAPMRTCSDNNRIKMTHSSWVSMHLLAALGLSARDKAHLVHQLGELPAVDNCATWELCWSAGELVWCSHNPKMMKRKMKNYSHFECPVIKTNEPGCCFRMFVWMLYECVGVSVDDFSEIGHGSEINGRSLATCWKHVEQEIKQHI